MSKEPTQAARIFKAFETVIQNAEEIWGPELPQYIELMEKIIHAATWRKNNALNVAWNTGVLPRNVYDTRFDDPLTNLSKPA